MTERVSHWTTAAEWKAAAGVQAYMTLDLWLALGHTIADPEITDLEADRAELWARELAEVRQLKATHDRQVERIDQLTSELAEFQAGRQSLFGSTD